MYRGSNLKILITSETLRDSSQNEEFETLVVEKLKEFLSQKNLKNVTFYIRDRSVDHVLYAILKRHFPDIHLTEFVAEWHKYKEEAGITRNHKLFECKISYVFLYLHEDNSIEPQSGIDHVIYVAKQRKIPIRYFKGVYSNGLDTLKQMCFVEVTESPSVASTGAVRKDSSARYNQLMGRQQSNARGLEHRMNRASRASHTSKIIFRETEQEIMRYGKESKDSRATETDSVTSQHSQQIFRTKIKRAQQQRLKRKSQLQKRKNASKKDHQLLLENKDLHALAELSEEFSALSFTKEAIQGCDSD